MSCFSSQEFSKISITPPPHKSISLPICHEEDDEKIISLPRGGCIIKTLIGNIQFGMPPETVKDALNMQLDVPLHYIIPTARFNRKYGLNVAEFEFPAYFNFFIRNKKINLICTKEAKDAIQIIFQETLLGPQNYDDLFEDFYYTFDKDAYPDFKKELGFFSRNPTNPSERLTIDMLLNFTLFEESDNTAKLENGVISIQRLEKEVLIFENGKQIANILDEVDLNLPSELLTKLPTHTTTMLFSQKKQRESFSPTKLPMDPKRASFMEFLSEDDDFGNCKLFSPPEFGVTVLGCSHGFDPKGSTSGYVFWINGRGIMVDPPPFSTYWLKKIGISSVLIDAVILSHCHADHDSGVFQKILDFQRVEMITTRTIMHSFLRKYSALSGLPISQLSELFLFRPAVIGVPLPLFGAKFNFFYSFHPIPCIGFEVFYKDKSIYFSADHFYNPEEWVKLKQDNILSEKRYEQLMSVKFDHSLILHEAGVPPIHTPQKVLAGLSEDIKSRLYLVHVAEKEVIPGSGLKSARAGFENTFCLIKRGEAPLLDFNQRIEVLSCIDIFETINLKNLREVLEILKEEHFKQGDFVIKEGEKGFKFYIVAKGIAKIYSDQAIKTFSRYVSVGDYFGEIAVISQNQIRQASVIAMSELTLLSMEKHEFLFVFGNNLGQSCSPVVQNLLKLSDSRKTDLITLIFKNSVLSEMKPAQKTQLELVFKHLKNFQLNETVWLEGDEPQFALLIQKGFFILSREGSKQNDAIGPGYYVGEVGPMIKEQKAKTTLISISAEGAAYVLYKSDFVTFLNKNPGLLVYFSDIEFCN